MIKNIRIKNNSLDYIIKIGNGSFIKNIINLKKRKSKKYILIDSKVNLKFSKYINKLNDHNTHIIKINCSEKIKSIESYWKIISILLKKNIDRSSIIIVIGGGTLGDLAGFIASTILRGIEFILIPTTLLSQVDSSIGGKNGINSYYGKNLIGTFYHPSLVIIDPIFLKSLPFKQIKSGYAEIVKHAIIKDFYFFQWLEKNSKKLLKLKSKEINYAIEKSIKIKAIIVLNDEKENLKNSNSRAILNFGHTFGHALESSNKYNSSILHGEAVSTGMIIAAKISYLTNNLSKKHLNQIVNHFISVNLPIENDLIKKEKFFQILINDKKNLNNKINLILIKKIGKAFYAKNFELNEIRRLIYQKI